MFPYCCRGESSCHATRRYLGPEGDLYLHRCDITIVALKVTVMTPVHFGPAIRMVLTFSLPTETRALGMSSQSGRELWALGPSPPLSQETTCNSCEVRIENSSSSLTRDVTVIYMYTRDKDGGINRIRFEISRA